MLSVLTPLDREQQPEIEIVVEVSDSSRTGRLATECTYVVQVLDVNDNAPIFTQLTYTVTVSELAETGTHFFQ